MISIQSILLIALGFLCASFVVLLIGPAFWRRAVRMTTQRLKETLPLTEDEIRADKDRIRVEYAMQVHRLEKQVKDNKLANARRPNRSFTRVPRHYPPTLPALLPPVGC